MALHRISDVPLGVLLSGGLDSAAVTALLARGGGPVKTFTVGFAGDEAAGELPAARAVARHLGTEHHEVVMGPGLADALPGIVRMQDEPVADPAAVPTFYVCRLARALGQGRADRRGRGRAARRLPALRLAAARRAAARPAAEWPPLPRSCAGCPAPSARGESVAASARSWVARPWRTGT